MSSTAGKTNNSLSSTKYLVLEKVLGIYNEKSCQRFQRVRRSTRLPNILNRDLFARDIIVDGRGIHPDLPGEADNRPEHSHAYGRLDRYLS